MNGFSDTWTKGCKRRNCAGVGMGCGSCVCRLVCRRSQGPMRPTATDGSCAQLPQPSRVLDLGSRRAAAASSSHMQAAAVQQQQHKQQAVQQRQQQQRLIQQLQQRRAALLSQGLYKRGAQPSHSLFYLNLHYCLCSCQALKSPCCSWSCLQAPEKGLWSIRATRNIPKAAILDCPSAMHASEIGTELANPTLQAQAPE